ncbi:putative necrosis-inducing factor-domain-containing protein [Copromyces sp. CBS 386.78]|nr:putative necrosis-inducing factor-domain-containing protein [Copromyces sp. CBS 386.78]
MRTPYGFVSFVAAILAASTVTSLVVPTDVDSSLAQAPDAIARPTTLPIRNIATRDDVVVSGIDNTTLHNDGSFWMAPLADDDDDDDDEIPADQPDMDLVPRYGPGAPPDRNDPHKVYCKDFKAITDETSDASPWIEDCLGIIPNIQPPKHAARWRFMIGSTRKIVSHKSCVLAVSANNIGQRGSWMNVGNVDVIAVIEELAMMREAKGGKKMGGKTTAQCTIVVTAMPGETEFSIFHT